MKLIFRIFGVILLLILLIGLIIIGESLLGGYLDDSGFFQDHIQTYVQSEIDPYHKWGILHFTYFWTCIVFDLVLAAMSIAIIYHLEDNDWKFN